MLYLLPQAVERWADRTPDAEAARCGEASLTYAELATRAGALASVLQEMGVRRGDRVGLYASKSIDSPVALHGIMAAGAAYVPLDPTAPPARLETIVRDCGVRHLVTEPTREERVVELASAAGIEGVVGLDGDPSGSFAHTSWSEAANASPLRTAEVGTMEQDLAYVLYTSGSTGVPKGVMHSHRSALAFAEIAADTYGFTPDDRLSNHAPLHFDLSTMDYFSAAVAGASTVVIPEAYTRFPASFAQLIETAGLTVLYTVPLALVHLLLHGAIDRRDLSSVRWVLFGGEPFPTKHLRALMRALPGARFSNVYGPTEVNGVTYWPVPELPEGDDDPIPIGVPFGNAEMLIVDDEDEPVPPGAAGELLVRTPTMMMGYWGRPDLNERAFYHRPTFEIYEDVFHRTGDLVRRREDGALDFLGRKDRQIKTRGYRVELDEVEAALASHAGVESAAVFSIPDGEASQRIMAAVVLRPDARASAEEVRAHAATSLPPYAVPAEVGVLDAMPRTTTGKIDRLALTKTAMRGDASDGDDE